MAFFFNIYCSAVKIDIFDFCFFKQAQQINYRPT